MSYTETTLPNPEDLLKVPESYEHTDRGDLTVAVLASVLHAVRDNLTRDRLEAARRVIAVVARRWPELAGTTVHMVANLERELLSQ
jgi:hypothetical protein